MPSLNELRRDFIQAADFLTIYVMEAHAADEWRMGKVDACYRQPKTMEQRRKIADIFLDEYPLEWPLVLDTMENIFESEYAAWPERLYVISSEGILTFKSSPGPHGFDVQGLRAWLADNTK